MTFVAESKGETRANPLLQPWTAPHASVPFDKITPADYEDAIIEGINRQKQEIAAIVNQRSVPTFENTIAALDRSGRDLDLATLALSNLEHANGDTVLMNMMTRVTPLLSQMEADIMLNERLFDRIKQVYDRRDQLTDLTPEQMRLLTETYRSFANNGAMLKGDDREKYRKLMSELSDLNVKFAQNVTNEMKSSANRIFITEAETAGLPESIKEAAREEAREAMLAEGKMYDGSYLFTLFMPSYSPFMKYSSNRPLREKLYRMYNSRNQGGEFDNTQVLKDIANVRLEVAQLLGKKNFAEYQLQSTMAANPEGVYSLLNQLREAYTAPMKAEIAEIEEFARKTEGPDFKLMPWDYSYWADKLKNERYAFNDEDMKPYFELNNTIDGVFGLATRLYGYTFKPNKDIPVYHPDAAAYDVVGPDGKVLGVLYTDFYYRPGKAPGAWMTEFRTETKDDEGNRTVPLISIVMNFSKPVGDKPVLLTPYEVETFLHEFGHALHGLSSEATYQSLSGTNVYHDFVELPSQFNENFLTQKKFLDTFAKHYQTGKKMPQSLIDRFIKASQFGAAYACMRQLNFGFLDMAYHTQEEPMRASASIADFENKALEPVRIFDMVEGSLISPSFAHIFSGGYASGYYGYKWAEVLDADAFAAFKENGIFDKNTAEKFRKLLQAGGTVDPMELYVQFRGKQPTVDALLERDGIKPAKKK
ncbi:MAG: M3 family metallopeptidase [Muribaculaceae bacterium]|nr:M3 family metallopeptidase [Muribaculaceae bacterium]